MGSRRSTWKGAPLAAAFFLTLNAAQAAGVSTRTYDFPYQNGDTVIVQNDYGRVRVQVWDAPRVQAEVKRIASDEAQLANVAVVAQKSRNKIFVNAYFYQFRAESVYAELKVPRSANLVIWGANPAVELTGLDGYVRAYTQTGLITATDLTSSTSLTTETGDIMLTLRRQPARDIRLESVQGEVRCEVSPDLNLRGWMRAGGRLSWNREVELNDGQLERQLGVGGPLLLASSIERNVTVVLNRGGSRWADDEAVAEASKVGRPAPPATRYPDPSGDPTDPYDPKPDPPVEARYPTGRPDAGEAPAQSDATIEDYRTNPDGSIDSGYSLKVNVNWTYLNVSVRDRYTNRSVPNLRREDFVVYEDGVAQQIERFESNEAPFNLLLLLDVSGSTKSFIDLIKEASVEFTREIKSNDSIGVAVFNSQVRLIQPFTNDRARVERSIRRVRSGGGTAFYDALDTSIHDYMADLEGRKAIVVFSDGVDNQLTGDWSNGSRTTFRELYRSIQEIDTIIYTIFLDTENGNPRSRRAPTRRRGSVIDVLGDIMRGGTPGGGGPMGDAEAYEEARRELRIIADQTGGRMYSPRDIYDLNNVYSEIADDLRVQYTLGYASSNTVNDGRWRSIDVRIGNNSDYAVRARKGYYAPGGPDSRPNP